MSDDSAIGATTAGLYGVAGPSLLSLREATIAAAWNLQGDAANPVFNEHVLQVSGISLPTGPNTISATNDVSVFWLGPATWLLVAGSPVQPGHPLSEFSTRRETVNAAGGALFDLSASRVAWNLAGPRAAAVLASACPLDFHVRAFPLGSCAQSLFGHVNALYVRHAADAFTIFVARSFARDVWASLCSAGAQYGYEVSAPLPYRQQPVGLGERRFR